MGTGYSLFLVDPAHEAVKALEVWEPEEATCEPANPEGTGDAGALACCACAPCARMRRSCACALQHYLFVLPLHGLRVLPSYSMKSRDLASRVCSW
jgi:hypothetical protein